MLALSARYSSEKVKRMYCPKCGSEALENVAYCGKCGASLPVSHSAASNFNTAANAASHRVAADAVKSTGSFGGMLSSAVAFVMSLPKAALAAIAVAVVVVGGASIAAVATPHGDIPNGTYRAEYGTTSIGQGGSIEVWGDTMSIKNIAGSAYYTDMSPYKVTGGKLYYSPNEDDYFWISSFYSSTSDGRIVFDYRKSGADIVLDGVVYYKK